MRVVSLVPSLTEAVAVTGPGMLVGATDWCTHPAGLTAARIGGTKNPDVAAVVALRPDLVVANEEENREPDLAALREAGLDVLVTEVRTLGQAFAELERVLVTGCGLSRPAGWTRPRPRGRRCRLPGTRAPRSCPSGAGRGWCWAATRSPATCWPAPGCATCTRTIPSAIPASRSPN